ncbi:hypothetical protein CPB86DRAFT_47629 [Serendipita vermifera]|nr:hypothetical protein CPB86DRAFT_47629 [Serendipita vermifera]
MDYKPRSKSTDVTDDGYQDRIAPSKSDGVSGPGGPAPIHRLPPEVLRMVLVPVVLAKFWPYFGACLMLSSVCRRWRELLNEEKGLWNDILITCHKKVSLKSCSTIVTCSDCCIEIRRDLP